MKKKILYFDCQAGISGDMTLGALIHLGADIDKLRTELKKLDVTGYELIPGKGQKNGITGVDLDVKIHANAEGEHFHYHDHNGDGHGVDKHDHGEHDESEHNHASYKNIRKMIEGSGLTDNAKKMALDIFEVIAKAEAAVHDMPIEDVVFHEVGAVDSIVDIVGAAICIDLLEVDEILCSPVHDGSGYIECRHGIIPVPVPAVMEMLKGSEISIVTEDVDTEMVTPTGFAILKGLGATCMRMPEIHVTGVGYGFGKRDTGKFNAVRVVMGTESHIDDPVTSSGLNCAAKILLESDTHENQEAFTRR